MARENTVIIHGVVAAKPVVSINSDGEPVIGAFFVLAVRRGRASRELLLHGGVYSDRLLVQSRNSRVIKEMIAVLREGDTVTLKGTLSTLDVPRKFKCGACGHITVKDEAVSVFIDPIFIKAGENIRDKNIADIRNDVASEKRLSKKEAQEKIKKALEIKYNEYVAENSEISNMFFGFGVVLNEPNFYDQRENGMATCDFQISTDRARRITEDGPEKKADYPWVKTYGDTARDAAQYLKTGSVIFIDGAISAKLHTQNYTCENCGNPVTKPVLSTNIVPYRIEYLQNWNHPDDDASEAIYDEE